MSAPGHFKALAGDDRGAVLVIFAVFAPVAVLFAVFAIDAGNWYLHKRHLQLQADAGVLATVQGFRQVPCSNGAIEQAARQYSGISGNPLYNENAGEPSGFGIHELINSRSYYNQPKLIDPSAEEKPPCEANMVDVKLTENNLPWYFNPLSSVTNINAHARVEILQQGTAAAGVEPLAVAESAPVAATAYFVDESNKNALLAQSPLTKAEVNARGEDVWKSTVPAEVTINHPHIGVVVALSGKVGNTSCGQELVECLGRKSEGERASLESAEPLLHIAGYSTVGTGTAEKPLAREVTLAGGTCSDGYFSNSTSNCSFAISAAIDWGSTNKTGVRVEAEVAGVKTKLANTSGNVWTGVASLPQGTGSREITLLYECKKETGSPCQTATAKATFTDVHRIYAASPVHSSAITAAFVGASGGLPQDADSFAECATCKQNLSVTVDVEGSLSDATGYSDPIRKLKFAGVNQIVECIPGENPSANSYREHLAKGCPYRYKLNTNDPTCTTNAEPYDCVAVGVPGVKQGASQGIDKRLISEPPAGTKFYCPNQWKNNNGGGIPVLPNDDSRIIQTFILPYGALNEKGESNLANNAAPIQNFAAFYVMGFVGDEKRCIETKEGDPKTTGAFEIWGHFIKYVNLINGEGNEKPKCREDPLGECVAVLTK
jgi:Putative Flp pilus-assembly TadE/G-like